jgi:hypothetical protein
MVPKVISGIYTNVGRFRLFAAKGSGSKLGFEVLRHKMFQKIEKIGFEFLILKPPLLKTQNLNSGYYPCKTGLGSLKV